MQEFFAVPKIPYEGAASKNPLAFKHYNPAQEIAGKPMKQQLKFALSYWHTMCGEGTDMFGAATVDRSYGKAKPMVSQSQAAVVLDRNPPSV